MVIEILNLLTQYLDTSMGLTKVESNGEHLTSARPTNKLDVCNILLS